ncbi:glycosyltransferase [Aquihabitans sp. G128]|uniref:glycosyltransferase n=1 Tax=Aquihabitans sp. G128 TaxID=2849779 RepID=UPI001C23588C|nr:glycosyltransferase [Aquihabitans sp. G128]QXC62469.1 glycosyltransferase [Aquihabitans sp. G128]
MDDRRVVMGLLFYPRGGSAYVVRYLSPALARAGREVSLAVGSLGVEGDETHAPTFFAGLDVHHLDSTEAAARFAAGGDAIAAPLPMHPSYEDRVGVPDVVLAAVPPELAGHLAAVWEPPLQGARADDADVFHLHHLTPQLDAVHRGWPGTPMVVHLHGTEMKLVAAIDERATLAAALGETLATMPKAVASAAGAELEDGLDPAQVDLLRATRWGSWIHGEFWTARLQRQALVADHVITVSPQNRESAISMFGIDPDHVTTIPNGVDIERFRPQGRGPGSRREVFRRALVSDPHGWTETGPPGTIAYDEADLDRLLGVDDDATVLLYVGRFLDFKRVPALIRAFAEARDRFARPVSLVVWGGHPGEWEGEHPFTVAQQVGADDIYFTGWRGHDDLPAGLAACDVLVVPSVEDPYPQVPLEAMAVGLPVVACASGGLLSMVNLDRDRPTGWLVPPDDHHALVEVLAQVADDPAEIARRGANARAHARANLSWDGLVPRFEATYAQGRERHARR